MDSDWFQQTLRTTEEAGVSALYQDESKEEVDALLKDVDEMTPLTATGDTATHGSIVIEESSSEEEEDDDDDEDVLQLKALFPSRLPSMTRHLSVEEKAQLFDQHALAAERLSIRLMQTDDEDKIYHQVRESLDLSRHVPAKKRKFEKALSAAEKAAEAIQKNGIAIMVFVALAVLAALVAIFVVGEVAVGPPRQPVGPYKLVELQEGEAFFDYYQFYVGRDSAGSNGYNMYTGKEKAQELGIINVTHVDGLQEVYASQGRLQEEQTDDVGISESFVFMGSAPTPEGPRDSIRLEGKRRFNRGLFIIDLRHMPAGCGVWPAFWLTDEANWPVNGEIDIVEGVNYQNVAKTALHSTKGCSMDDVPHGVKTGTWDTAVGIPDRKTGIPDMTMRFAQNCFVYDPHQWLNQGCVAVDLEGASLGVPLNEKGGGVYVLEWDPINRHIRTWVFAPHATVPDNLRDSIRTAGSKNENQPTLPDPDQWGLPYGYFPIGEGTNCPADHFRNMRLVFNLAFCGSVAGNRFHLDCPKQAKQFKTCNDWLDSEPPELDEAYWKIRGVYVYEREWEQEWLHP